LRLALQNIFSTPKKTIFSMLVFMVISFITLILCLMMLEQSYGTNYDRNPSYNLKTKDRLVVYDKNHQPLNKEILESVDYKEIYYNAFYEESGLALDIPIDDYYNITYTAVVGYTYKKLDYTIFSGRDVEKDGEYVLVYSENGYYNSEIPSENGRDFYVNVDGLGTVRGGRIVGFATTKEDISVAYLQCYSTFGENILNASKTGYDYRHYYTLSGTRYTLQEKYVDSETTHISLPKSYEKEEITFYHIMNNLYEVPWNIEIRYEETSVPYLIIGDDYFNYKNKPDVDQMDIYEAVIYTDSISKVKSQLEAAGYRVSVPSEKKVKPSVLNLVTLYLFLSLTIMALICLFFVTYVILARVYASKNKDYGVLRTLGMVKKQLGRIVILEVLVIGILSSLLSLIIFIILISRE
ncbi:MAG: hypothetical protein K2F56_01595, partial [Anaeroplasmataceae bacterium]|nr:hypothetical protein [Anaeroplasmataceae bacterium]